MIVYHISQIFARAYEQGADNALYFAEEVMPSIDRKKNIRVGLLRRKGNLSRAGAQFAAAIRTLVQKRKAFDHLGCAL